MSGTFFFPDVTLRPIIRATNSPDMGESFIRAQLENFSCAIRRPGLKAGVNNGLPGQMLGPTEKLLPLLLLCPPSVPGNGVEKEFSGIVFVRELS
ncbi:hypothetical protein AVEN_82747-1 [Araneus ventricosus]|uniref:Uncharacterized protein n=1 Tax=Araneus ventricosus TaxID=182803 RepID=A0A4Y2EC68_ARAVE|nr:hypothetical protein AVEN_82747-1 [Araneus ventricosus]